MNPAKTKQYPYYQSDVADDEEYETEPPRPRSSVKRYQAGDYQGKTVPPVAQRSSQRRASQPGRRTTGSPSRTEEFASAQTERLSPQRQSHAVQKGTHASRAVKPLPRRRLFQGDRPWKACLRHPLVAAGGGMCTALLLLLVGRHAVAWSANSIGDPLAYTQAANRTVAAVVIGKHHAQIAAFVDPQTHQEEAIVIPDTGTPQLLTGKVVPFAHPLVSVQQEHNGDVQVTVQGPYDDNFWWPQRPTTQSWTLSFEQKPAQK